MQGFFVGVKKKEKDMEKVIADLHTHTVNSDGTFTVEEVVKLASEKGLDVVAVTDHDSVDGLRDEKKLREYEEKYKVEIIKGIEMSCNLKGKDVHILGYFLNLEDKNFLKELERIAEIRNERNEKIIKKLADLKLPVTMEELLEIVQGNVISKAHFAEIMLKKGYVSCKSDAFKNYLGKGGAAFVEKRDYQPADAVDILVRNGAFVSLAHPKLITDDFAEVERIVSDLVKHGLRGLEVNYYSFSKKDREKYMALAEKYNLIITGGSDFHGVNRVESSLGGTGLNKSEYENLKKSLKKV